jgi:prephenate dehydrogenase
VIYGVGLLGGSLGLAAKKYGVAERVLGLGRNESRLRRAQERGAVDTYATDLSAVDETCDLAIVCTPVGLIPRVVLELAKHLPPGAVLTDVGSTKAKVVQAIHEGWPSGEPVRFVGSHPMAGSEKTGVEHATADLYFQSRCVVTPLESTCKEAVRTVESFWTFLGGRLVRLSPEEHDRLVAFTSHVPHLTASALSLLLGRLGEDTPEAYELIGNGFRDGTRTAAGDPVMWRDICLDNAPAITEALDRLVAQIQEIRQAVHSAQANSVEKLLAQGRAVRRRVEETNEKA